MERWKLLACLVSFTFFMENLDATVIATALPQMAASFGRDPVDLNLGISAYLLAIAVGIPVSGWIAERFGPRPSLPWRLASSPWPRCSVAWRCPWNSSSPHASSRASGAP